jgi:hypothetical protein
MRSPFCLCVSVCPSYQLLNQLVDFYEIQYGEIAIEGDLDAIVFNTVAAIITKWRTFKLLRWMQNLHQSTQDHGILYSDRYSED